MAQQSEDSAPSPELILRIREYILHLGTRAGQWRSGSISYIGRHGVVHEHGRAGEHSGILGIHKAPRRAPFAVNTGSTARGRGGIRTHEIVGHVLVRFPLQRPGVKARFVGVVLAFDVLVESVPDVCLSTRTGRGR